jgi:hypothetical protein
MARGTVKWFNPIAPGLFHFGGQKNYARFRQFFSVAVSRNVPMGAGGSVLIPNDLS